MSKQNTHIDKNMIRGYDGLEYIAIVRPQDSYIGNFTVILSGITEKEEEDLDKGLSIKINKGNTTFHITPDDCYCYGKFDITPGSKDLKEMEEADWFRKVLRKSIWIPAEYDYETHAMKIENKTTKWFDTVSIEKILPYYHNIIGKPERIIIFKDLNIVTALKHAQYKKYNKNKAEKNKDKQNNNSTTKKEKKFSRLSNLKLKLK